MMMILMSVFFVKTKQKCNLINLRGKCSEVFFFFLFVCFYTVCLWNTEIEVTTVEVPINQHMHRSCMICGCVVYRVVGTCHVSLGGYVYRNRSKHVKKVVCFFYAQLSTGSDKHVCVRERRHDGDTPSGT